MTSSKASGTNLTSAAPILARSGVRIERSALAHGVWYYAASPGVTYLYADINGDGAADLKIQLNAVPLHEIDFVLTHRISPLDPGPSRVAGKLPLIHRYLP